MDEGPPRAKAHRLPRGEVLLARRLRPQDAERVATGAVGRTERAEGAVVEHRDGASARCLSAPA